MDTSCRVCLRTELNPSEEFYDLFSLCALLDFSLTPANAIMECAPVLVNQNDSLPSYICSDCVEKLQTAYNFRTACIASDAVLHQANSSNSKEKCIKNEVINNLSVKRTCYKKSKWKCKICTKKFESFLQYKNHFLSHAYSKKLDFFKCYFCNKVFRYEKNIKKHLCVHAIKVIYKCPFCKKSFKTYSACKQHKNNICQKKSNNLLFKRNTIKRKLFYSKRKHKLFCKKCGKGFKYLKYLHEHINKQHRTSNNKKANKTNEENDLLKYFIKTKQNISTNKSKNRKRYVCTICKKVYERFGCAKTHIQTHNPEQFNQLQLDTLKEEIAFSCNNCDKEFTSSGALKEHLCNKSGCKENNVSGNHETKYRCVLCKAQFDEEAQLREHIRLHTGEDCNDCGKNFPSKDLLNKHVCEQDSADITGAEEATPTVYSCTTCTKLFTNRASLDVHLRSHTNERPFTCDLCNKGFKQKAHMVTHRKIHTGDKAFKCESCGKSYITNSELTKHKRGHSLSSGAKDRQVHKKAQQQFMCEVCPKTFPYRYMLVKHTRSHTGEAPFVCEVCGKAFRQHAHLRVHLRTHTGEKPHACNVCGKPFTTATEMRAHMVAHTDAQPFPCSLCGKTFKWKIALWRHMKRHSGDRPNKCTYCDKTFIEYGSLRRHLRVHTGERPQVCKICGNTFKESTHLKTHMKIHNDIIVYTKLESEAPTVESNDIEIEDHKWKDVKMIQFI